MASNAEDVDSDTKENSELEKRHYSRIINAFKSYKSNALRRTHEVQQHYENLSERHKTMIPAYAKHLDDVALCINHNHQVYQRILQCVNGMFENEKTQNHEEMLESPMSQDMDKLHTVLRQIMRDWSSEGTRERSCCYGPVLQNIQRYLPLAETDEDIRILVPGAGLGRLSYDLAALGYTSQGNEWSLFMIFTSNFILNHCKEVDCMTIYPWVHSWVNNLTYDHQIRPVTFPDLDPSDLSPAIDFSMTAGDFLDVYTKPESWHGVATVYFIDTAHNIIAYVENIWSILKPGGYWFNHGPLLYHYTDVKGEQSIDLCYDELRNVILLTGFVFETEERGVRSTYTHNLASMLQYTYHGVSFVVRKPL